MVILFIRNVQYLLAVLVRKCLLIYSCVLFVFLYSYLGLFLFRSGSMSLLPLKAKPQLDSKTKERVSKRRSTTVRKPSQWPLPHDISVSEPQFEPRKVQCDLDLISSSPGLLYAISCILW